MRFFGLQTTKEETLVGEDETPDARNETIDKEGRVKTRPGMSKGATSALGGVIYGLFALESDDGTVFKIVIVADEIQAI